MNALSIDEAALDVNNKKRRTGYDTKVKAKAAAVATIGEHARDGFEFEVFKVDGRWQWRAFDVVKPPTPADLKASGGKKAAKADAIAKAADQARHEERGAERAKAEGRLRVESASSLVAMAQQISGGGDTKPEAVTLADLHTTAQGKANAASWDAIPAVRAAGKKAARKAAGAPNAPEATVEAPSQESAPGTIYGAGQPLVVGDGLDLPTFLKRNHPDCPVPPRTKEEQEAAVKRISKTVGPERVIKNPPNVKQAKAKAEKRETDKHLSDENIKRAVQMLKRKDGARSSELQKELGWTGYHVRRAMRDVIRKKLSHKTKVVRDGRDTIYKIV